MRTHCRTKLRPLLFCAVLVCAQGCANRLQYRQLLDSAAADVADLPGDLLQDSKYVLSQRDNLLILSLAGGASIAMNQGADKDIQKSFDKHEIFHNFTDRTLKTFGHPGFHFAAVGAWYLAAIDNNDTLNHDRAWTTIRALSLTTLATFSLKTIRNNDTPVDNSRAWPSGHTSSSFALASVLDEFYGPRVGLPAYALASLVGIRMMDQGDHWASDVVFGAALGWVIGHSVAAKKELQFAGFKVLPCTITAHGPVLGVNFVKRF